ncbi:glycosyltransferase family protein [bacterium]|nr:glycosyltransferase family protein [bacterium]MBU0899394.1 glycosyltransferase family protein [bacterium]MBU1154061.1 glycosyltransferase family protein [bacterium]MBU1781920.1 glycosyltransferase family protein [bacterium]MBU2599708.1 glycosyltransferase family protein [bacterium]
MKIGAIIQARTSSSRLPRKVLKELPYGSGITVLQQVIRRLNKSKKVNEIIVATTTDPEDKKIVKIAESENVKWFRGSKEDVLGRYYSAANENNLDLVIRVTSDCPCIDSELVDLAIKEHLKTESDYTSNDSRTFPRGLGTEVINFKTLEKAFKDTQHDYEREHVTPYIYKTRPDLFKITLVKTPEKLNCPEIRITLDTEEDYVLLCIIFDYLYYENMFFKARDIIQIFQRKPWLELINKKIAQKKIYDTLNEEMKEVIRICELQDLKRAKEFLESQNIAKFTKV